MKLRSLLLPALAAAVTPTLALAHPGHDAGTIAGSVAGGIAHPLGGADHLLAMVAVGLYAAQAHVRAGATADGRMLWAAPATFVGAMLAGGAIGFAGLALPGVEPAILASVIVLGAVVALAARVPAALALPVIALFGIAHGVAHGAEGPATGLAAYAAGFALATLALHGAGIALGLGLSRAASGRLPRILGALTLAGGAALGLAG
ncbi:HupE/UreJ family protein [Frigidibacter sp. MR17.24]|uniref:HupE/UreJ family protein n=1 Tax=Frigidibacter sp. MR17.24 TaxID=3127345 RepID=UPI003012C166